MSTIHSAVSLISVNDVAIRTPRQSGTQPNLPAVDALAAYQPGPAAPGVNTSPERYSSFLHQWTIGRGDNLTVPSRMDDFDDRLREALDEIVNKIKDVNVEEIHSIPVRISSAAYKEYAREAHNAVGDYLISKGIDKDLIVPLISSSREERPSVTIVLVFKRPSLPDNLPAVLEIKKATPDNAK